jgi:hypothetical protein
MAVNISILKGIFASSVLSSSASFLLALVMSSSIILFVYSSYIAAASTSLLSYAVVFDDDTSITSTTLPNKNNIIAVSLNDNYVNLSVVPNSTNSTLSNATTISPLLTPSEQNNQTFSSSLMQQFSNTAVQNQSSLTNIQPQPNTNTITPYNPYQGQQQPQAPSPSPYQYPDQQQVQIISASDGSNEIQNGGTTFSTSIIFTFQGGGDTATNSYQCTIDGQGPPYLCKSPVTLTNLAVGSHTIQVNNTIFTWSIVAVDDEEKQGVKVIPDQQTITSDAAV